MEERLTYKEYLKVTVPFMISTVTQPLLGAVNTAIMGHMDNAMYIAAVALGVILFNNMYWLFGFLRVATTVFSAQALGEQSKESASLSFFGLSSLLYLSVPLLSWDILGYLITMQVLCIPTQR
ncbi:MATE domain protein [Veillonella sp. oral taxon 780 str. F0422]|nr:MATE domain protein [Veillonella sp. oral taxon 780 str. F0422]